MGNFVIIKKSEVRLVDKKVQRRGEKAIEKIALREGTTVASVRKKMEQAIDLGWNHNDPQVRQYWQKSFNGKKPSVEEFILFVADKAKKTVS